MSSGLWKYIKHQLLFNFRASYALRSAFYLQFLFMIVNNLIFFLIWWIFFTKLEEIRGWKLNDLMLLYGVVVASFGLSMILAGGFRRLPFYIARGRLDSFLTQPRPVLLSTVLSESVPSGWGNLVTGFLLFFLSGYLEWTQIAFYILVLITSTLVFVMSGVLISSLGFWLQEMEGFARQWFEYLVTISCYPSSIFTSPFKIVLYTVLPAGFIGYLPVDLIRQPQLSTMIQILLAAIAYTALAQYVFHRGLRRYVSANTISLKT